MTHEVKTQIGDAFNFEKILTKLDYNKDQKKEAYRIKTLVELHDFLNDVDDALDIEQALTTMYVSDELSVKIYKIREAIRVLCNCDELGITCEDIDKYDDIVKQIN